MRTRCQVTTAYHWDSGQICQMIAKGQELVPAQKSGEEGRSCVGHTVPDTGHFHSHWPGCPARGSISAGSSNSPGVHWRLQHLPRNVKNSKSRITILHFPAEKKKISVEVVAAPCSWSHLREHEKLRDVGELRLPDSNHVNQLQKHPPPQLGHRFIRMTTP